MKGRKEGRQCRRGKDRGGGGCQNQEINLGRRERKEDQDEIARGKCGGD